MARSLFARLAHRYGPQRTDEDRRAVLKATMLASAGVLLSGPAATGRMMRAAAGNKKVCVVGGGFAGLACAHELAAAGYAVIVMEARNRVGGRVITFADFVKGRIIEGGGELIGSNHPTWAAYREAFGLNYLDVTEAENVEAPIVLNGQRLNAAESEGLYKEMEQALSLMNADAMAIDEDEPWKSPNAAGLDARTTRDWIRGLDVSALCKMGLAAQLTADNGVSTAKQSYLGNLAQVKGGGVEKYWTDTEVYRCKEGNQALAVKLALELGQDRCVVGAPVKTIVATGLAMEVTCADGRKVEVDDVVLAVPPSVWKTIEFRPPLPPALAPQMGVNVKYLSSVKSRFWKEKGLSPDALSDGEISMTWDATDNQPGDEGVCLTAFSGGPSAEAARAKDAEKRKAAYGAALEEMYPGYAENFVEARFMDWPSDPLTQAGYSFPAPGQVTTMGPLMRKAQSFGKLHIAGEHACYKFVGYMEGALNSGASVARRIAERDGAAKKT